MESTSSKLNRLINEFDEEKLVRHFELTLVDALAAARETQSLITIVKRIFINSDKRKLNKASLTHHEWQEFMFQERLEEAFLNEKSNYETVSFWYWLINKKEEAMEYYYQLCNNEINFTDIKSRHSNVHYFSNQATNKLEPTISKALRYTKLNIPTLPFLTKQGYLILQKDSSKNAKLDSKLKQKLLDKLEDEWFLRELIRMIEET